MVLFLDDSQGRGERAGGDDVSEGVLSDVNNRFI